MKKKLKIQKKKTIKFYKNNFPIVLLKKNKKTQKKFKNIKKRK